MARKAEKSVKIDPGLFDRVVASVPGDGSQKSKIATVLESGLKPSSSIDLDDTEQHQYFSHLKAGKGKEYQADLIDMELTEQGVVDLALKKTGLRLDGLMKQALLSYAKNEITLATRREWQDKHGGGVHGGSVETRIQKAFATLTDRVASGEYSPRSGQIPLTAIAQEAKANYNSVKKWAEQNQPELLGV